MSGSWMGDGWGDGGDFGEWEWMGDGWGDGGDLRDPESRFSCCLSQRDVSLQTLKQRFKARSPRR